MSNKQQTAVDWLVEQIDNKDMGEIPMWIYDFIEQAKKIEKDQITEGFKKGLEYWNGEAWKLIDIEQYYKETYETSN